MLNWRDYSLQLTLINIVSVCRTIWRSATVCNVKMKSGAAIIWLSSLISRGIDMMAKWILPIRFCLKKKKRLLQPVSASTSTNPLCPPHPLPTPLLLWQHCEGIDTCISPGRDSALCPWTSRPKTVSLCSSLWHLFSDGPISISILTCLWCSDLLAIVRGKHLSDYQELSIVCPSIQNSWKDLLFPSW